VVCVALYLAELAGVRQALLLHLALTGVSLACAVALFFVVDRGLIVSGSVARRARRVPRRPPPLTASS
jgi:hypothetical protein